MIILKDISKRYSTRAGEYTVFDNLNFTIRAGEKIGILGRNGAGKSTLIRILSGAERPTSGTVYRGMSLSWPLAFAGAFQGSLTGLDNLKFICRVYGVDYKEKIDYVQNFTELGKFFNEPVKTYSSGMRSRLAFAISMAIEFDCFLIDEITAVGDARFHEKCQTELFEKRKDRAFVMVSHHPDNIRKYCSRAAILHKGHLTVFNSVDEAYEKYKETLQE